MSMNYATREVGEITVVDLSGRISLAEAVAFGPGSGLVLQSLVRDLASNGHPKVLLNLKEITYIDSSGLGDLVASMNTLRSRGGELRICNVTPRVDDLLRITHLDSVLNFDADEPTALASFGTQQKGTAAA
jgi:anti-sigma B factor antagonist